MCLHTVRKIKADNSYTYSSQVSPIVILHFTNSLKYILRHWQSLVEVELSLGSRSYFKSIKPPDHKTWFSTLRTHCEPQLCRGSNKTPTCPLGLLSSALGLRNENFHLEIKRITIHKGSQRRETSCFQFIRETSCGWGAKYICLLLTVRPPAASTVWNAHIARVCRVVTSLPWREHMNYWTLTHFICGNVMWESVCPCAGNGHVSFNALDRGASPRWWLQGFRLIQKGRKEGKWSEGKECCNILCYSALHK